MGTIPILGNPDLGNRELFNMLLQKLTADPGSPVEAMFFYRDDTDRVRVRVSGAWKDIAFTDDVATIGAGSIGTTELADHSVTNAKMTQMPANTVKMNNTGVTADSINVTRANFLTWLAVSTGDVSGLGSLATLSAITSTQITDGTIMNVDINTAAAIAISKLQTIANNRILGNISGGTAVPVELTPANVRTFLGTLDADTLGGNTAAQIVTSAVNQITNGAGAAYDTLIEIQNLLTADEGTVAALTTTVSGKNKAGVAADLGTSSADAVHNHALNTRDVLCQLVRKSDWKHVIAPFTITDLNNVTWNLDAAPSAGQYRSIIIPASAT